MINSGLGVVLVALTTLCTAVIIGLGFLPRPSRASAIWSLAFAIAMISSYAWVAANAADSAVLRAASAGTELGSTAFVWVGLRARRNASRLYWPVALTFTIGGATLLAATATTDYYAFVFRVVFALGAVFAALIVTELVALGATLRDEALPLALGSAAFLIFAVVGIIDGAIQLINTGTLAARDGLTLLRDLNLMGSIVYLVAALITLLLLTRLGAVDTAIRHTEASSFRAVANDRLQRAETAGDEWWCVLDIRLDDPVDLREASSTAAFLRIAEKFRADVRSALPPDADIEARGDTGFVALLPRPEGAVRQLLSQLLEQVAKGEPDQPIAVRLSASIGWADVDAVGYDLDALLAAAEEANTDAQRAGGDRWERASVTV
ncbi:hypothetical protein [Microbacterium terricola]|uniref:GGDEF domain-containing protein n=1 Tax=Microbacterium terricola TaxID=344163 RepID=A0ABM8DVX3_9MICO|nr:hypothetical protein [Microbacterium terricola]UYK39505.1 hypothetical protein OAU46_12470 [Microbacterium terricola]BDV29762.1 hypothetical protein Microterr_04220 [Microbacterium terricola]